MCWPYFTECSWWTGPEEPCDRVAQDSRGSSPSSCATGRPNLCRVWPQERWLSCWLLIVFFSLLVIFSPPRSFLPSLTRSFSTSASSCTSEGKTVSQMEIGPGMTFPNTFRGGWWTSLLNWASVNHLKLISFAPIVEKSAMAFCRNKLFFFVIIF